MFSRWCFHPSTESSSLIMMISVKSQLYPPVKHIKVGHVPWKLGIHDPCLDMVHCHVWFPVSSHVTLKTCPWRFAWYRCQVSPRLQSTSMLKGRSPSVYQPSWGWNLHWISGDVKQNPIKISEIWRCVFHIPKYGTFTKLWKPVVSEEKEHVGKITIDREHHWQFYATNNMRWICLKNGEIIPKTSHTYHRENVQTNPCLLSQGNQGWHLLNH